MTHRETVDDPPAVKLTGTPALLQVLPAEKNAVTVALALKPVLSATAANMSADFVSFLNIVLPPDLYFPVSRER